VLLFTGAWSKLRRMSYSVKHRQRMSGLGYRGVDRPRRWSGRRWMRLTNWANRRGRRYSLGRRIDETAALIAAAALATINIVAVLGAWQPSRTALAAINGVGVALLIFIVGVPGLQSWRIRRHYHRRAVVDPHELVPTAGPIFGKIVGRDDLCRVLMEDLRDRWSGPQALIGGPGTGKTAVLVRLTGFLADKHLVPVPIRLRDAVSELDFEDMARERFFNEVNPLLNSSDEGEKVWRRLLQDGRIIVLADGLEEALSGADDADERDGKIRLAIRNAYDRRLPLLIASRPFASLREMDATIHELEPLSEDAALAYVAEDGPAEDERLLSWIVETADVADAPLYLQITKEIYRLGLLDQIATRKGEVRGTAGDDPSRLRVRLLQTWQRAMIRGDLRPDVPLRPEEREAALVWLSALACVGLRDDSLVVRLDSVVEGEIHDDVMRRLERIGSRTGGELRLVDQRLAAAWGARLGLVELASRVRFQHSLIQAFLGSQLMDAALRDPAYVHAALYGTPGSERTGPGREFLIALVLHSRSKLIEQEGADQPSGALDSSPDSAEAVYRQLAEAASARHDDKALDMYAAAMEISSIATDHRRAIEGTDGEPGKGVAQLPSQAATKTGSHLPQGRAAADDAHRANSRSHIDLAEKIQNQWPDITSADPQALEEAKLELVFRFGKALRTLAGQPHDSPGGVGYAQLYEICLKESSYRIRLAAAREIGRGGAAAFQEIKPKLEHALPGQSDLGPPGRDKNSKQRSHHVLRDRAANAASADGEAQWAQQVSAWLAPLLVASIAAAGGDHGPGSVYQDAEQYLRQWRERVRP